MNPRESELQRNHHHIRPALADWNIKNQVHGVHEALMGIFVPTFKERNHIMAIKLIAAYSKKVGLPGYSSHSFSVSMETELSDVANVPTESERLYALLQESVDKQIQSTGFVPPDGYGMNGVQANGNGHQQRQQNGNGDAGISEKQLDLINRVVRENNANKAEIENMSVQMFGGGVRTLNRMQASNLIDELFAKYPKHGSNGRGNYQRQPART